MEKKLALPIITLAAGADKLIILLISLVLIEKIGYENFGKWSFFYQIILIGNNLFSTPQVSFYKKKFGSDSLIIFNLKYFLFSIFIFFIFSYYSFNSNLFFALSVLIVSLLLFLYNYYNTIYRFINKNFNYLINTLIRLLLFVTLFFICNNFFENKFSLLILSFSISLFIVVLYRLLRLKFNRVEEKKINSEYFSLVFYGIVSTLSTGAEKIFLVYADISFETIGIISYVVSLSFVSNFLVDIAIKYLQPKIFSNLRSKNYIEKDLKRNEFIFKIILVVGNILIPLIVFYTCILTGVISLDFSSKIDIIWIIIAGISMGIYSLYHFFNMRIIFYNKSFILAISVSVFTGLYFLLFVDFISSKILYIFLLKLFILSGITFSSFLISKND